MTDYTPDSLREPRAGVHEDGTEEEKSWETLYEQCVWAAARIEALEQVREAAQALSYDVHARYPEGLAALDGLRPLIETLDAALLWRADSAQATLCRPRRRGHDRRHNCRLA